MENWGHSPMRTLGQGVTMGAGDGRARAGARRGRHAPRGGGGAQRRLGREVGEVASILRGIRS